MYTGAKSLYKRSQAIREKSLGPEHPDVVQSLNNRAELLKVQARTKYCLVEVSTVHSFMTYFVLLYTAG